MAVAIGPSAFGKATLVSPPKASAAATYHEGGRLLATQTTLAVPPRHRHDRGQADVYVFSSYGDVYDSAAADNLIAAAEEWAATHHADFPIFFVGDFNVESQPYARPMGRLRARA